MDSPYPYRFAFLILLTSVLLPATARTTFAAGEKIRRGAMVYDCARYLMKAIGHNFRPLEAGIEIGPGTLATMKASRSVSDAASNAVTRWIQSVPEASRVNGEDLLAVTHWPLTSDQRSALKKIANDYRTSEKVWMETMDADNPMLIQQTRLLDEIDARLDGRGDLNFDLGIKTAKDDELDAAGAMRNWIADSVKSVIEKVTGKDSRWTKAVTDIQRLVIGDRKLPIPGDVSFANVGLIQHWSQEVQASPILFSDSLDFYSRLKALDTSAVAKPAVGPPLDRAKFALLTDPPTEVDIWALALESTEGDRVRAIRVLGVFGHDDQMQFLMPELGKHPEWAKLLNTFVPKRTSLLYANGAIPGLGVSLGLKEKFAVMEKWRRDLRARYPEDDALTVAAFRSANYHFTGGLAFATELVLRGHGKLAGFRLPVLVSELLGKLYKRLTMEANYLGPDERVLFSLGYPRKKIARPAGMDEQRFAIAQYKLELNLLHLDLTHEQHRLSAEWALDVLKAP